MCIHSSKKGIKFHAQFKVFVKKSKCTPCPKKHYIQATSRETLNSMCK